MDYNKIAKTLLTVTNGNQQIQTVFEATFRENVSSLDLQILASGQIPSNIISNCIASALQRAADKANALSLPIVSAQIWNPLTAILLHDSINKPQILTMTKQDANSKHTKEKASSKKIPDNVSVTVSNDQSKQIRKALKQNVPTSGIYNNFYHSHISCVKSECKFCYDLYHQVNVSRCDGHKPCHETGYFPHVGKTLWKMIKGRHQRGEQCKLKEQKCKTGHLPNLNQDLDICVTNRGKISSEDDWNTIMEQEPEPKSPVYYPSTTKRLRSELESGSISDSSY